MISILNTINKLSVEEKKINITSKQTVNTLSVAPIGIQGPSGVMPIEASDTNKILTNNGTSTYWTDIPDNITLNGGYF